MSPAEADAAALRKAEQFNDRLLASGRRPRPSPDEGLVWQGDRWLLTFVFRPESLARVRPPRSRLGRGSPRPPRGATDLLLARLVTLNG